MCSHTQTNTQVCSTQHNRVHACMCAHRPKSHQDDQLARSDIIGRLSVLTPTVLFSHLSLLLWREVVDDVELLPDFFSVFALDHAGNLRTCQVQEALDLELVRRQDNLEQHLLFNVDKVAIPLRHAALVQIDDPQGLLNLHRWK